MKAAIIIKENNGNYNGAIVGSMPWRDILSLPPALIGSWIDPLPTAPGWASQDAAIAHYRDQGCQVAYLWRDGWELIRL